MTNSSEKEPLTADQFSMFNLPTWQDTNDATSSQESASGITPLTSRDGRKIYPFGRDLAHASHLVQQVDKQVKQTIGTYGPNGSASSASAALQLSLESKLQTRLPTGGLTMFIKGWKRKATPLGRLYCQLAASAHPIEGIDYSLWPTAKKQNANSPGLHGNGGADLQTVAAMWATPTVSTGDYQTGPNGQRFLKLSGQAALWATPKARDGEFGHPRTSGRPVERSTHLGTQVAVASGKISLWATPNTMDHLPPRSEEGMQRLMTGARKGREAPSNLREQVVMDSYSLWATPAVRDHKDTGNLETSQYRKDGKERNDTLGRQAYGSTAPMENKGSLNAAFAFWLMGIPLSWMASMQRSYTKPKKGL